ncbi:MAG: hypothetical protein WD002_09390 [Pseudomonadales bacterium]
MNVIPNIDENRRRLLIYLLGTGVFATVPGCASGPRIQRLMPMPEEMPEDKSIFQIMGEVTVNGMAASLETRVNPGDVLETDEKGETVFVFGKDAFLMRANSRMQMPGAQTPSRGYALERGKALSVFASRATEIRTPTAVIAIRGTGVYVESEPELSYVCTCYGTTDIAAADDPTVTRTVVAQHHDEPVYVLADRNRANRIAPAPFKNHDDQELLLIETLVGRSTPYVVPKGIKRTRGRYL